MTNNIPFRNADYALADKHTKAAVIRLSGNDSLADLSETTMEFNTTTYNGVNTDPDNLFDTSDYKLKTPGRYFVSLNASILANNNIAKSGSITFAFTPSGLLTEVLVNSVFTFGPGDETTFTNVSPSLSAIITINEGDALHFLVSVVGDACTLNVAGTLLSIMKLP
jgi:hypothetical protein